jgi:hypothetical protein
MSDTIDLSGVLNMQRLIDSIPAKRDKVIQRTKSTLARRLPVETRRDIQTEVNLPAARISVGLSSAVVEDGVTITGSGRGIGLTNVPYSASKGQGVTARVYAQGAPLILPHAFVATGNNGGVQVFQRIPGAAKVIPQKGRYAGTKTKRQPLKVSYAPSIGKLLAKDDRRDRLAEFAATILHDESERLLDNI